jgi:hypothetical protein
MGGGVRTYIYCQPPAGGRIRSKVTKCNAYGVAIMNERRGGWFMKLMKLKKKGKLSDVFYFAGKFFFVIYLSSLYMGKKVKTL